MKKQTIVVTGAMGYIATELLKIYSGEARFKRIIGIDNRFVSERVKQLRDWGIEFVHGETLDRTLMQEILKEADIVYHCSGTTNVSYVSSESNDFNDNEIHRNGVIATQTILDLVPKTCKIIFPSTHVIYESLKKTKFDIEETEKPKPTLAYSKGKVQSETDIKKSKLDYIIVRLGSVIGYSGDTMRINIMPNLFSKITSQNGNISLFSGGVQHKSLVVVQDVVRAMKFLAESEISKETFHLSNENMTIKQVAEICKKYNPKIKLIETEDEIPNLGYTLSNKKLLATGFKFLYTIENSIKEMIENWSAKEIVAELEYIITGQKEFIDERGKISNYELPEPINLIGYIESKKGTVRANHYHPIQEQKCLLVNGRYVSVIKDLSDPKAKIEIRIIRAGDIAVIKPNVAHTMIFLQDSVFLNLVRGEREHENYGVTHTIPYELVDEIDKETLLSQYKSECRSCGNENLKLAISLGMSPLANNLVDSEDDTFMDMYPLEVDYCPQCFNCQLSIVVPPEDMFDDYLYVSSTSASFRKHFEDTAIKYIEEFGLNENSLVLDIGSNDGVFLKPLQERGIKVVGIEPAKNIAEIANQNGIPTINDYVTSQSMHQVYEQYGSPDLITASNVFAHSDKLAEMAQNVFALLNAGGTFIIEVQYLLDTIKDLTFDNIYHEHTQYWSANSLHSFFKGMGFCLYHAERIPTHGGSIRCYISKDERDATTSLGDIFNEEGRGGIGHYQTYKDFAKNVAALKENAIKNIQYLKSKFKTIAGYGSPAKATTALNYFGIGSDLIEYTIEDNPLKHGKLIPNVNIPIVSMEYAEKNKPDVIIILAWNFYDPIREKIEKNLGMLGKPKGNKATMYILSIKDLQLDEKEFKKLVK